MSWAGYRRRYSDWLRAGRSGDRIPVGGEVFRTCPDRPWGPPSLLYNGYRLFPGGEERPGRAADLSPLLVPRSRKSIAMPLLPIWAVRPVQSLYNGALYLYRIPECHYLNCHNDKSILTTRTVHKNTIL